MTVLFICTGSICRSPVAEYLLRDAIRCASPEIPVSSAGTMGMTGNPMDPRSLRYLADRDIDGSVFTARRLNRRILQDASLVIGFEQQHVDACLTISPGAISRTFRLSQLAAWQRSGELTALDTVHDGIREFTPVTAEHEDPVGLSSEEDFMRVLDGIFDDVRSVAALIAPGA